MISKENKLSLKLQDREFPFEYIDHDREIARGIVFDEEKNFYFVRIHRDDSFGKATLIETSGGGVEKGESFNSISEEAREAIQAESIAEAFNYGDDIFNASFRNNYQLTRLKRITDRAVRTALTQIKSGLFTPVAFEEEFDVEIPDEDAQKIKTVKDVIEYIESKQ